MSRVLFSLLCVIWTVAVHAALPKELAAAGPELAAAGPEVAKTDWVPVPSSRGSGSTRSMPAPIQEVVNTAQREQLPELGDVPILARQGTNNAAANNLLPTTGRWSGTCGAPPIVKSFFNRWAYLRVGGPGCNLWALGQYCKVRCGYSMRTRPSFYFYRYCYMSCRRIFTVRRRFPNTFVNNRIAISWGKHSDCGFGCQAVGFSWFSRRDMCRW